MNDRLCIDSSVVNAGVAGNDGVVIVDDDDDNLGGAGNINILDRGDDGFMNEHFDAILIQQQQLLNRLEE